MSFTIPDRMSGITCKGCGDLWWEAHGAIHLNRGSVPVVEGQLRRGGKTVNPHSRMLRSRSRARWSATRSLLHKCGTNKNPPGIPGDFLAVVSQSDHSLTRQLPIRPEHPANTAYGLANPVLILDQGEPHVIVAVLTETDTRRDADLGFSQQLFSEL